MLLVGCGDEPSGNQRQPSTAEQLAEIASAKTNPIAPEQVSEVFALGSEYTDLQRDILRKELVGSVVEWDIRVYEIEHANGIYKVSSQPIPIKSKQAINMMRASFSVYPQDEQDHELLRQAKTNDRIRIRGKVQDIVLRAVVVIEPALLASPLAIN
ncbi:MAG: hypothetical protein Q8M09_13545 [Pseudomonadota bacterium]|nr:hypothetical protein [Pseudomonadota bacterium]MDP1905252.1 hypothetical protein [Pseudomonadota bacterium]MDP2352537.1 hypothetical protein [Pseudomonadota bacterium]